MKPLGLVLVAALAAAPATAQAPNFTGSMWLGVATVPGGIEVRLSSGANLMATDNTFGAKGVVLSHDYFRLTAVEVEQLATGLEAWAATPHSDTVYRRPGEQFGFSVTGSAWSAAHQPVVVLTIMEWFGDAGGPGHHHGGPYMALYQGDVVELAAALRAWLAGDDSPAETLIYTKAIS